MKYFRLYLLSALLSLVCLFANGQVNYNSNTNTLTTQSGYYPSALGSGNTANGKYSLVGGTNSIANGECSFSFGSSAVVGANGYGAVALGFFVESTTPSSFTLGRFLKSNASSAFVIGSGNGSSGYLINQIAGSLMVGFNSQYPTFFVSNSPGGSFTGKIGIGNITNPTTKLHLLSDAGEAAELKLEHRTTGLRQYSQIYLGTHTIRAGNAENMVFTTPAGKNYAFQTGNVGIGTEAPTQKLDVDGNIRLRSNGAIGSWSDNALNFTTNGTTRVTLLSNGNMGVATANPRQTLQVNGNILLTSTTSSMLFADEEPPASNTNPFWGKWGIEYHAGGLNFWTPYQWDGSDSKVTNPKEGDDINFKLFLADNGNVGIGTGTPMAKFHVNGLAYVEGKMLIGKFDGVPSTGTSTHSLFVAGGITSEEVVIKLQDEWPDYVFKPEYKLPTLGELQQYITDNGHLPGLPSADDVKTDGVELGEMNARLLQKIEELTLYILQQEERIKKLEKEKRYSK